MIRLQALDEAFLNSLYLICDVILSMRPEFPLEHTTKALCGVRHATDGIQQKWKREGHQHRPAIDTSGGRRH